MAFIAQRKKNDCGVASLAMLCDVTYEEALHAIPWRRRGMHGGTTTTQLREGGEKLGYRTESTPQDRLKVIRAPDHWAGREVGDEIWTLIPDNSLVKVPHPNGYGWHWVAWRKGKIYDPDRGVFTPEKFHSMFDYLAVPSSYMQFIKENTDA